MTPIPLFVSFHSSVLSPKAFLQTSTQLLDQLGSPLRRHHDAKLRVHRQRHHNRRIDHVQILHANDRRVHIDARADATTARPMVDLALRVRRRRGDVLENIRLGRRGGDVERGEVGLGQGGENVVYVRRDVLGVLRVGEVDALGARDEVAVEDDLALGLEARGAIDVERDGAVARVAVVPRGADGALHARLGAVRVADVVPEDGDFPSQGVGSGAGFEVEGGVGGDGVVVDVVIGLDGGAGELDEGVWVVKEAVANGGVVDPGGGGKAAQLVGGLEAGEHGRVADTGFHEKLWGFQGAGAQNNSAGGRKSNVGYDAA